MKSLCLQINLTVRDGDHVGGNVGGHISCLGLDDRERGQGSSSQFLLQAGRPLQQPGVEIKHISRIGFPSGGTPQQQGDGAVRGCVPAEIIVDDQRVFALFHPLLPHGTSGKGRQILKRSRFPGSGNHHRRIFHRPEILQCPNELSHGGSFLTDCHVDALYSLSLLMQDGIQRNGRFPGLAVADNQFPLASSDGYHGIDGLDPGLQRCVYRFSVHHPMGFPLHRAAASRLQRPLFVHRLPQGIYHPSQKTVPHGYIHAVSGAFYLIPLIALPLISQQHRRHRILLQIERHTVHTPGKLQKFAKHTLPQSIDSGNPVRSLYHPSHTANLRCLFVLPNPFFDYRTDFFRMQFHRDSSPAFPFHVRSSSFILRSLVLTLPSST